MTNDYCNFNPCDVASLPEPVSTFVTTMTWVLIIGVPIALFIVVYAAAKFSDKLLGKVDRAVDGGKEITYAARTYNERTTTR